MGEKTTIAAAPVKAPDHQESLSPSLREVHSLFGLQQTVGNQAMMRLLRTGAIQAKLRVSQPGDADELEADRVAERIVSSAEPAIHRQRGCEGSSASLPVPDEGMAAPGHGVERTLNDISVDGASVGDDFVHSLGSGRPLDDTTRQPMETKFGRDFSQVRIHTDDRAAASAQSINARAYALGSHVVFDSGEYAPQSSKGQRLLAHELAHVAQSAGVSRVIARQPAGGIAQEAISYVKAAIESLESQAAIFRADIRGKSTTFDDAGFRSRLTRLKNVLDKTQGIIDSSLNKDPGLTRSLQSAYKSAIDAAIAFAADRQKQTSHVAFETHADLIADWALPQAVADKSASELTGALPAGERTNLTVITTGVQIDVDNLFSTKTARLTQPLPKDVTVEFSSGVPPKLRPGLTNVAGTIIPDPLRLNSTITLALDLEPFGGDFSQYRFTFLEHAAVRGKSRHVVMIERLGAIGVERKTKAQAGSAQKNFLTHGFTRGSGWSDDQFELLEQAIAQVPNSLLSPVDGITFKREEQDEKDPNTGGNYNPDTHTITMFKIAFQDSLTRVGAPGKGVSTDMERAVAHEIGHAVDLLPLRNAWKRYEQAGAAVKTAFAEFENPPGSGNYRFPSDRQATWNALSARVTAAERSLTGTRADSGERYQKNRTGTFEMVEGGTAAGSIEFREAATKDGGKRITEYSNKSWQEYYAESFSLYVTDQDTLQRLRPKVFEFFVRHHPK